LGLGDRFVFAGFRRDVAATLSAFDLSVVPSLWEGTPITAFEALAMGKPIVATDADGLLDVLTDGRDAVIVPKRDARALADGLIRVIDEPLTPDGLRAARALAQALMRVIDEPLTRERLRAAAYETGKQYDIAAFVRKMERLYDILHRVSRATQRKGVLVSALSFLTTPV